MAFTDSQLLTVCANFTLHHTHIAEEETNEALQTSGATRLVNALHALRLQRAILAVGMFSIFEALMQSKMNRPKPFEQLRKYLTSHGKVDLAASIDDYMLAINVLKHGEGRSHTNLVNRASVLPFKVRTVDTYFEEGDVSEIDILVDADDNFVQRCAELIEEAAAIIHQHEQVWL